VPKIVFEANPIGPKKEVDVPDGGELVDICDDAYAPIAFSCRSVTCGTCHVRVLEGAEHLEPPAAEELELLDLLGTLPNRRLACQVVVRPGPGCLRIVPIVDPK
jgi:ferredoxin